MAGAKAPAASLRLVPLLYFVLVILSHLGQAQLPPLSAGNAAANPPSYEELSSSLVVNQLAILQMMQDVSNVSCAAADAWRQKEEGLEDEARVQATRLEEAVRLHLEQVMEAVEARQQTRTQEVLEAISTKIGTAALETLTRVTELREEMRQKMDRVLENMKQPEEATPPTEEAIPPHFATMVHNDTVPSLCNGDKFLLGSRGTLEVVNEGTYTNNLRCSWNITLPAKAPLRLTWDYIDMEQEMECSYDWVKVVNRSYSATMVYGRRLCGQLNSTELMMLNVVLPPTRNIFVSFGSDGSNAGRGFRLHYQAGLGGK